MLKRSIPLFVLMFFSSCILFGQDGLRLGLSFSPNTTLNRITTMADTVTVGNQKAKTRFSFGLITDIGFSENYYFSSGIFYSLRAMTFVAYDNQSLALVAPSEFNTEYFEIPITLKLYTNEIGLDSRIFFQTGFAANFLVNKKGIRDGDLVSDLNFFDSSFVAGGGFEKAFGLTTAVFLGLTYQRGLLDVASKTDEITFNNDLLSLNIGVRL